MTANMDEQLPRGPTLVVMGEGAGRGQLHVAIRAVGQFFEPYMGFNIHLRWDPTVFAFSGAYADGGLFDPSRGAALAMPPDTANFDRDGGGVVFGCVSLVGSTRESGLLATIVLTPVTDHGCSFLHLFTFRGIDGGNESTGTFTVAADGTHAQHCEYVDASMDVIGQTCAASGRRQPESEHKSADYWSCFFSFGEPDLPFADRLYRDLRARNIACWLYNFDATAGAPTWPEITRHRRAAGRMLVFCSRGSLNRPGVLKELEAQVDENPDKIIPLSLDNFWRDTEFKVVRANRDLKPPLTERNWVDFDGLGYRAALERLLRALRKPAQ